MTDATTGLGFLPPAKIQVPVLRTAQIARPQIETVLRDAMMRKRLVLVSAPAGFGKTTAMIRALARCGDWAQAFWFSIDEDDTIQRFLGGLVAALDPADVPWRVSAQALAEMARDGEAGPGRAADAVADALSATDMAHGIFVVDDIHRLNDALVIRLLDRLIERLPSNWTLAIATRIDPPLALARLRLRGELAELRSEDLRFGLDEFGALAAIMAPDATEGDLESVWRKMSGWPAGCELALRAGLSRAALSGVGATAFEVLSSEVLNDLPEKLRLFLLQCSILPELSGPLCEAVTGDAETPRWLREIMQRGLFATAVAGNPPVLKLHDLFRDFLQARLREEVTGDTIRRLLIRAADAEDSPERRIGFLTQAGDFATAEKELLNVAHMLLLESEGERVLDLVGLFPAAHSDASGEMCFISGLCASSHSRWLETQRQMSRSAELFRQSGDLDRSRRARAHEIVAYIGLAMAQEAMVRLAELEQEYIDTGTRALCAFARYWISRVAGTVEIEIQSFDQMLDLLMKSNDPTIWNECALHIYLGGQRGMRARAERYATAVLSVSGDNQHSLRDSAMSMRACHQLLIGDYGSAAELIREIESNQNWRGKPHAVRSFVYVAKSLLAYLSGDVAALRDSGAAHLAEFTGREGISWAYWRGTALMFVAKLLAALDDWDGMKSALGKLDAELHILDMPYLRLGKSYLEILRLLNERRSDIPDHLLAAIAQRPIVGDIITIEPALDAARAIVHARRHEYAKAWTLIGAMVAELIASREEFHLELLGRATLTELANVPSPGEDHTREREILKGLVAKLARARKSAQDGSRGNAGGLTQRELEILELIALGDSNKIIARKHALSPHTVKRHVANILDKLGLASRGQAAAWFRDHAAATQQA